MTILACLGVWVGIALAVVTIHGLASRSSDDDDLTALAREVGVLHPPDHQAAACRRELRARLVRDLADQRIVSGRHAADLSAWEDERCHPERSTS